MDGAIRLDGQKTFCKKVDVFPQQSGRERVYFLQGKVWNGVTCLL
jgi:hypothetical protein